MHVRSRLVPSARYKHFQIPEFSCEDAENYIGYEWQTRTRVAQSL